MKKIFFAIIFTLGFLACTDNFEEANRNNFLISDAELDQDFNRLGSPFQGLLSNLFGGQVEEDLLHDNWTRMLGTPTPFVGGVNNTTYYMRWNRFWGVATITLWHHQHRLLNRQMKEAMTFSRHGPN